MLKACESSNADSGSDHSVASSDIDFQRNGDCDASERNNVVSVSRLLAAMLEGDELESSKVSS